MLAVERLTKSFGGFTAVAEVELVVEPGSIHAVIGPNGAGKTTLFNLVTGVIAPSAGRFLFEGQDITGWRADRITTCGVARTFQNIRLFREMTAIENVMVGAHCRTSGAFWAAIARWPGVLGAEAGPLLFFGLTDLFIVALAIWDFRSLGKLHPVTLWGGLLVILSQPLRLVISGTDTWMSLARWLTSFLG